MSKDINQVVEVLYSQVEYLNVLTLDLRRKVCVMEAKEKLAAGGWRPKLPIQFRSQFGEDVTIWDLLGGQTCGFFIECGAFDGVSLSVTYALEAMGWTGLLVEAIPERHEQCVKNRPYSRVVNAALSRRDAPKEAVFTVTDDHHGGMLSYLTTSDKHKETIAVQNMRQTQVTVPCTTMDELLKDYGLSIPIDVAVIDVEGGELDLLDGFDLLKHKPRILILEDNEAGKDPGLGAYMATQPYVMVAWVDVNRVYVHRDEAEILARVKGTGV